MRSSSSSRVSSRRLAIALVCTTVVACAPRTKAIAPVADVDAWLARRYPSVPTAPSRTVSPVAKDVAPPPSTVALHEACAQGDPRACFELRDRDAYRDPRGPIVHRGCFGSWMERQGDLDDKNIRNINAMDGGLTPSR